MILICKACSNTTVESLTLNYLGPITVYRCSTCGSMSDPEEWEEVDPNEGKEETTEQEIEEIGDEEC
mgnify:FL=1